MLSAEEELRSLVAADQDPELNNDEIMTLMRNYALNSVYSSWQADTAYGVGAKVVPNPRTGSVFVVTVAGTSGSDEPNWTDATEQPVDGTVTWQLSTTVEQIVQLNRAAAQGWRLKAGKCANRYAFKTDVTTLQRDQMFKQCLEMSKLYKRGAYSNIPITGLTRFKTFEPVIGNVNPAP